MFLETAANSQHSFSCKMIFVKVIVVSVTVKWFCDTTTGFENDIVSGNHLPSKPDTYPDVCSRRFISIEKWGLICVSGIKLVFKSF